jgi:hypothetical protein
MPPRYRPRHPSPAFQAGVLSLTLAAVLAACTPEPLGPNGVDGREPQA